MNGFINLKKERGMTSFKCVAAVRKILGEKKVGHGGTLDPEAEGVLPICVGQASKCAEYFLRMKKTYKAEVTFGFATDTMDIWGKETARFGGELAELVSEEKVREALKSFCGEIEQIPSMYSAIKKDGVPLYKLARKGAPTEVAARRVNVYSITLDSFDSEKFTAGITVTCSRGTYVRSICNDLGELLGCYAVMSALCRTSYGDMLLERAITVDELCEAKENGRLDNVLLPLEYVLSAFPSVTLNSAEVVRYTQGKTVTRRLPDAQTEKIKDGDEIVVYTDKGNVLAVSKAKLLENGSVRLCPNKFFGAGID